MARCTCTFPSVLGTIEMSPESRTTSLLPAGVSTSSCWYEVRPIQSTRDSVATEITPNESRPPTTRITLRSGESGGVEERGGGGESEGAGENGGGGVCGGGGGDGGRGGGGCGGRRGGAACDAGGR